MKILFTGGGTAGHITPIIAIVREIKLLYPSPDLKMAYLGPRDPFVAGLLSQEGISVHSILAGKIRRYKTFGAILQNIFDIFIKTPIGIIQSFLYLFIWAPDVVVSKGGYGSFPVVISAKILQIPIFLHESDVSPGLANRIIGRLALEIFVSFPRTEYFDVQKIIITGNPIRREILQGSAKEGQRLFNLSGQRPVILVLGGSQGSQRINDAILLSLPQLLQEFEVVHQAGEKNIETVKNEAQTVIPPGLERFYHPVAFFREQELKHIYQACDLVISRAGANTIFEIAAVGKPSILVPLPESAQNHQYKNAYAYAAHGAAIVMEEANFLPRFLVKRLKYLFANTEQLETMSRKAKEFSCPKAGQIIAEYILGYLTQK